MSPRAKSRLLFGYASVMYVLVLMSLCGAISFDRLYAPSYAPRLQAEAFLHGRLALSRDPLDLDFDLCWSQGGVNQVWGLGVPLWELPFEAAAKLVGAAPFPEWIALGIFIGLSAYVVLRTWAGLLLNWNDDSAGRLQIASWQQWVNAAGIISLFFFFPLLTTLLRYELRVYEEIMVYVYFFGMLLLCGLVSLIRNPKWGRFWLLCVLAGLGALIRPTLLFYGAATFVTAGVVMARSDPDSGRGVFSRCVLNPRLVFGALLFAFGGTLLFITNYLRFGSGWEFGHSLNLQSGDLLAMDYSTRFEYPFSHASVLGAARELMGALFQVRYLNNPDWYASGILAGQSPVFRWRQFPFSTYQIGDGAGVALAWLIGAWTGWKWLNSGRWRRVAETSRLSPEIVMIAWSGIAAAPLIGFYMKVPVISSRYMMDFAPAFVAALAGLWCWVNGRCRGRSWYSSRLGGGALATLLLWQGAEIGLARHLDVDSSHHGVMREDAIDLKKVTEGNPPPLALPNEYKIGDPIDLLKIPFNGEGWNPLDGSTRVSAIFFVQTPEFLEMEVAAAPGNQLFEHAANIRAKVGLEYLKLESVTPTNGGWILHFSGPKQPRYQQGLQPVFLAMVPPDELAQYALAPSPWILKRLQWRKSD